MDPLDRVHAAAGELSVDQVQQLRRIATEQRGAEQVAQVVYLFRRATHRERFQQRNRRQSRDRLAVPELAYPAGVVPATPQLRPDHLDQDFGRNTRVFRQQRLVPSAPPFFLGYRVGRRGGGRNRVVESKGLAYPLFVER